MSSAPDSSDSQQSNNSAGSTPRFTAPCCTMCNKREISKSYCTSCKVYLCEECNFFHEIMVRFNSHRVLYLDNVDDVEQLVRVLQNAEEKSTSAFYNSVTNMRRALQNQFSEGTKYVNTLLKMSYELSKSAKLVGRHRSATVEHVNSVFQRCQQVLRDNQDQTVHVLDNEYNFMFDIFVSHRSKIDGLIGDMLVKLSDLKLVLEDDDNACGFDFSRLYTEESVSSSFSFSSTQRQFDFFDTNNSVPGDENLNSNFEEQLTDKTAALDINNDVFPFESFNVPFVASEPSNLENQVNPDLSLSTNDPDSFPCTNHVNTMQIHKTFGQKGNGSGMFNSPHGFCVGFDEDIVVADSSNHRIQIFDKDGTFKYQFGVAGRHDGYLWHPRKVAFLQTHRRYVVCDRGYERSRMQIFTETGKFVKKIYIQYIDIVAGIAVTPNEDIVVVNSVTPTVFIIGQNDFLRSIDCTSFMQEPSDITVVGKEFYICDFKAHCVVVIDEDGNPLRKFGNKRTTMFPNGIDVSPQGYVFMGDSHGNFLHVTVYTRDGTYVTEFRCPYIKVSRCCGLKMNSDGRLITVDKNYHHIIMLEDLHIGSLSCF